MLAQAILFRLQIMTNATATVAKTSRRDDLPRIMRVIEYIPFILLTSIASRGDGGIGSSERGRGAWETALWKWAFCLLDTFKNAYFGCLLLKWHVSDTVCRCWSSFQKMLPMPSPCHSLCTTAARKSHRQGLNSI